MKKISLLLLLIGTLGYFSLPDWLLPAGAMPEHPRPEFTWANVRNGEVRRYLEAAFDAHLAARWVWIAIDRELGYTFFREFPANEGTHILANQGDWMFEQSYADFALSNGKWTDADASRFAQRWAAMQAHFDAQGVPLLLVIAPSKAEIFPEHLPPDYRAFGQPQAFTTSFERLRPALDAAHVRWYDGRARFQAWKAEGMADLFARSGSHWTELAAAKVAAELRLLLNPVMRRPIAPVTFSVTKPSDPRDQDLELLRTANLLFPRLHDHPLHLPTYQPEASTPGGPARILWVNDSFGWQLINAFTGAKAVANTRSLFYFRTAYTLPDRGAEADAPSQFLQADRLKDYDAIVVVMVETAVDFEGWGFLDAAGF